VATALDLGGVGVGGCGSTRDITLLQLDIDSTGQIVEIASIGL
jgi:hypothetical protein